MSEIENSSSGSQPDAQQAPAQSDERTPEMERAVDQAREFLRQEAPVLGKLTGLNVDIKVGQGWATDMRSGNFTIDPAAFVERGYMPQEAAWSTLHELWAHVRDVKRDPQFAARQMAFGRRSGAHHLFSNILTDIHGNKLMHYALPEMEEVGRQLYDTKLFPTIDKDGEITDYASLPLHIQFLYSIIRDEMIPGSETAVRPEVAEALDELRNYKGTGQDVIRYLTDPATKMSGNERFEKQRSVIFPVYQRLLDQAREERKNQSDQTSQEQGEGSGTGDPFEAEYDDYKNNIHPEPMTEEEHKKFEEAVKEAVRDQAANKRPPNPIQERNKQLLEETGHSLAEHQAYRTRIEKYRSLINSMRDVWQSVISERVSERRGLSRQARPEGVILDPDRLAQTVIQVQSGNQRPDAFKTYESRHRQTELVGNTDYFFFYDCSSSMGMGSKNYELAADTALIMMESLAAVERDIEKMEQQLDLDLDMSIRTACYTFGSRESREDDGNEVHCHKKLSPKLNDRERLDAYTAVMHPSGSTPTAEALAKLRDIPDDKARRRVVFVVTDGEPNDTPDTVTEIDALRARGFLVYAVSIGSEAAATLFYPHGHYIRSPEELIPAIREFMDETVNKA